MHCLLITHAFPIDIERVRIIGIWSSVSALSLIIGPILGGVLVHTSGWASIFLINIPIGIITVLLGWYGLSESADPENVALDPLGQLTSMLGLGLLTYGLIEAGSVGWTHYRTLSTLIVGVILLTLFLIIEKRVERPLLPLALFKDRTFFQYNLSSFTLGFATYSNVFFYCFLFAKSTRLECIRNRLENGTRVYCNGAILYVFWETLFLFLSQKIDDLWFLIYRHFFLFISDISN